MAKAKPLGAQALQDKARAVAAALITDAKQYGERQAELVEILQNKKWESH